jgi:restriction system protein
MSVRANSEPCLFGIGSVAGHKSGNIAVDHPTLQSLNGCIHDANADHGLIVSWSGFKPNVRKETNKQYFRVRFWGHDELIDALLSVYDRLPEDIRAALSLMPLPAP